jgi:hypothetical protein
MILEYAAVLQNAWLALWGEQIGPFFTMLRNSPLFWPGAILGLMLLFLFALKISK